VHAFRHAIPFANVDGLPDCPWNLFTRVNSWNYSGFQKQWFVWAEKSWNKRLAVETAGCFIAKKIIDQEEIQEGLS